MRKTLAVFIFLLVSLSAFCEAPELKLIMPNSWLKLTKISGNESNAILEQSSDALQTVYKEYEPDIKDSIVPKFQVYTIYKQTEGPDIFYRILISSESIENCLATNKGFVQVLCYKGKKRNVLLMTGVYNIIEYGEQYHLVYDSLDILLKKKSGTYGLLYAKTRVPIADDHKMIKVCKNQIAGKEDAEYFIIKDLNQVSVSDHTTWNLLPDGDSITISASDCLVDEKSPLKYSIQNAFDGDPATSFVENTDDDLMRIEVHIPLYNPKIAIINGYAQNSSLYKLNNRIKLFNYNYVLNDNQLDYQIQKCEGNDYLIVKKIYSGEKYNDTCIAELNFWHQDTGWLFGDIHE
jgi:hypothetical protein